MVRDDSSFGTWLSRCRRSLDLTQADLAERVGCSAITIRKIEADLRTPSRQIAGRLAACLAIPEGERPAFLTFARGRGAAQGPTETSSAPSVSATPPAARRLAAEIPAPLTALIGRDADVATVRALLEGGARLLTLTGPPGIGKTRLALEVAAQARRGFADGAAFVSLAAVAEHQQVLPAIVEALGIAEQRGAAPPDLLASWLQGRALLLVLDNAEHVLEAAPALAALLARCPGLAVLVTSQAALRVRGERRYAVGPLALPDPHGPPAEVARSPAVMLFVARAQEVAPRFALDEASVAAVAEICARLDGLPLALELVAARCDLLSPQALLARLGRRLALLTDGPQDLPQRHRTLCNAIGWSYDLLGPDERRVFRRLGVFAGGFELEAAQAVCDQAPGVEEALAHLVHHSLVQAEPRPDGGARYSLLETIREYALERMAPDELAAARAAHGAHFAGLVSSLDSVVGEAVPEQTLRRLTADEHNIRSALDRLAESDPLAGLRCAAGLRRYWMLRGLLREGRARLERLLLVANGDDDARARALAAAGFLAFQQGDHQEAEALAAESLAIYERLGDRAGAADALLTMGRAALQQARFAEAEEQLRASLALWQQIGGQIGAADTLRALGIIAKDRGELAAADKLCAASQELYERAGDQRGVARVLYNRCSIAYWQGAYARSGVLAEEAATIFRALDDQMGLAYALEGGGMAAHQRGLHDEARRSLTTSLDVLRALDDRGGVALVLHELGMVADALGDMTEAVRLQREALALAWRIGDRRRAASCLEGVAMVVAVERPLEAARLLGAAASLRQRLGAPALGPDRESLDRCVAAVRARIPAAFAGAWSEGSQSPEALIGATLGKASITAPTLR